MKRLIPALLIVFCSSAAPPEPAGDQAAARHVYIVPFSHLDFFWGGTREECLERGNRIIARAIELAKKNPEFRFLLEDNNFVANYVDSHTNSTELSDLKRLVKEGRIEIAPKWAAIFQDLQDGEILARNLIIGKHYARTVFGVDPLTAHLGDIPGYTPQFPQLLDKSGVPYAVMTRMGPNDKALFYWRSPDGSRALTWFSLHGYGWGAHLGLHSDLDERRREMITKELSDVTKTTASPVYMHWGTDLWAPNQKLIDNLPVLNKEFAPARFTFATPDEYFKSVAKTPNLPELSGEIPSSWPNIVSSLPHLWPAIIPATSTLLSAEKFAAIDYALGYAEYPQQQFELLWRKLVESTDHNHDGQGGWAGDARKRSYSDLAIIEGGEILRDRLRNLAERVQIPVRPSTPIVVFNPLGWKRDDVVNAHVTLYGDVAPAHLDDYKKGMRLVDEKGINIPFHVRQFSENISRALELVFVAHDVPPVGYKTYFLKPAAGFEDLAKAADVKLDDTNDVKDPRRALGLDTMENDFYRVTVDRATGRVTLLDKTLNREVVKDMEVAAIEERGGNYIGIEPITGRTIYNRVDSVSLEENNPVRAVINISGSLGDVPVTQRLTLYREAKRLDVENTLEWRQPRLLRIEQLFPYTAAGAEVRYGVPFGSNRSDNLMPDSGPHLSDEIKKESWLNARHVLDWVSAGSSESTVTIATDHQFIRLDGGIIRGEMLRGARYSSVKVVQDGKIDAMHYPPAGSYTFKYSITSGAGDWKGNKSYRSGQSLNSPLIPVPVIDEISAKTLPPSQSFFSIDSDNVVLSAIKKAEDGPSVIVRLYENEGRSADGRLSFLGNAAQFRETNILEEDSQRSDQPSLTMKPNEIKTLKLRTPRH